MNQTRKSSSRVTPGQYLGSMRDCQVRLVIVWEMCVSNSNPSVQYLFWYLSRQSSWSKPRQGGTGAFRRHPCSKCALQHQLNQLDGATLKVGLSGLSISPHWRASRSPLPHTRNGRGGCRGRRGYARSYPRSPSRSRSRQTHGLDYSLGHCVMAGGTMLTNLRGMEGTVGGAWVGLVLMEEVEMGVDEWI